MKQIRIDNVNVNIKINNAYFDEASEILNNKNRNTDLKSNTEQEEIRTSNNNDLASDFLSKETDKCESLCNSTRLEIVLREYDHEIKRTDSINNRIMILITLSTAIVGYIIKDIDLKLILFKRPTVLRETFIYCLILFCLLGIFVLIIASGTYFIRSNPILSHKRLDLESLKDSKIQNTNKLIESLIDIYIKSYESRKINNDDKYNSLEKAQKLVYSLLTLSIVTVILYNIFVL